jgi:hypothetical protein
MIATTIMSSISVKPECFVLSSFIDALPSKS